MSNHYSNRQAFPDGIRFIPRIGFIEPTDLNQSTSQTTKTAVVAVLAKAPGFDAAAVVGHCIEAAAASHIIADLGILADLEPAYLEKEISLQH